MDREALQTQYATLPTSELLEIVDRKFDYTELAVTVALEEIGKRNISESDIKEYKEEQIARVKTCIRKNVYDDLNLAQKILFFFIWLPLLTFPFRQNFREDDYVLKLKQANYFSLLGFLSMMLIGFSSVYYDPSNLTVFTIWFLSFLPAFAFDEFFNRKRLIQRLNRLFGNEEENDDSR